MNHPRAKRPSKGMRLRLFFVVAAVAAMAATVPAVASANITPTASTNYSETTPGAHGDYEIIQVFQYGGSAEPQPGTEDMKKWIVDSPAGLYGNPNAVPYEDRCDPAAFDPSGVMSPLNTTGSCPASSKVGEAKVYLVNDANSGVCPPPDPSPPGTCIPGGTPMEALTSGIPLLGDIYLLKTDPEVPTTLGTIFTNSASQQATGAFTTPACGSPPCPLQPKTKSLIQPVTSGPDGDFRLRTVPEEYSSRPSAFLPNPPHAAFPTGTPLHIRRIDQKLYGLAANGNPFITYPTRCSDWDSISYAHAYDSNGTATLTNLDPNHPSDAYSVSNTNSFTPSCTNLPSFQGSLTAAFNTTDRNANPQLDVVVSNPGGTSGDVPKEIVVKLPGSVAADIDAIQESKLCTTDQRDAEACPASSKVGTVTVETPLISAGLTGDVYIVKKAAGGIPDLSIFVTGAIDFRLDATTNYVGPEGAEIETTLKDLPQVPFTKFSLRINGGTPDSLLVYRECLKRDQGPGAPIGGMGGPITSSLTGYTGAATSGSQDARVSGCYGTPQIKSPKRCVKYKLAVTPKNMLNTPGISKVELYVGKTKRSQRTRLTKDLKSPWKLQKRLGTKFKRGKTYYMYVKTTYKPTVDAPSGKVMKSKVAKFKRCR